MYKLRFNNKLRVAIFIGSLFLLFVLTFVFPFWIISYFKFSGIKHLIVDNYLITIISGICISYFMWCGQYYYNIYIDNYVINITSYRPIIDFFKTSNFVDISHPMLVDYTFFNRPFTFNKILMLKINSGNKIVVKRFKLTMINNDEIVSFSSTLDKIIENNK